MSIHVRRATYAAIWQPVFGAYVALQVHERMRRGEGYDSDLMSRFVEEAETVADDAVEAVIERDSKKVSEDG